MKVVRSLCIYLLTTRIHNLTFWSPSQYNLISRRYSLFVGTLGFQDWFWVSNPKSSTEHSLNHTLLRNFSPKHPKSKNKMQYYLHPKNIFNSMKMFVEIFMYPFNVSMSQADSAKIDCK